MNPITLRIQDQNYIFRYIPAPRGDKYRLYDYSPKLNLVVDNVKHFYLAEVPLCDDRLSVKYLNWENSIEQCYALSNLKYENLQSYNSYKHLVDKNELFIRLPTEHEWEWAALGGEDFKYAGCTNLDKVAKWGDPDSLMGLTNVVKEKKMNQFGLYDMTGNLDEWTATWCSEDNENEIKPKGPKRIQRGGGTSSVIEEEDGLEVFHRESWYPDEIHGAVRLCFSANPVVMQKLSKVGLIKQP